MSARDLLQRRETDARGDTIWRHSPAVQAALDGGLVVLDGVHRLPTGVLSATIGRLVVDRELSFLTARASSRLRATPRYATAASATPSSRRAGAGRPSRLPRARHCRAARQLSEAASPEAGGGGGGGGARECQLGTLGLFFHTMQPSASLAPPPLLAPTSAGGGGGGDAADAAAAAAVGKLLSFWQLLSEGAAGSLPSRRCS